MYCENTAFTVFIQQSFLSISLDLHEYKMKILAKSYGL